MRQRPDEHLILKLQNTSPGADWQGTYKANEQSLRMHAVITLHLPAKAADTSPLRR